MNVNKEIENILDQYPYLKAIFGSVQERQSVLKLMKESYILGKNSNKCKEDKDNPYHIDHERQTKLDFNGME